MRPYQKRALERLQARKREADPIKVRLTVGTDYAHQGHRFDVPDERTVRHARMTGWRDPNAKGEDRWIDGRRYVWNVERGCWMVTPDLHRTSSPPTDRAPRQVIAVRGSEDDVLRRAVLDVVAEGGRPEEVTVIIKD